MPYVNLKPGQKVHVTVTATIDDIYTAHGAQWVELRHGKDFVSTVMVDDDSVDVAFDESVNGAPLALSRSVSCTYGCFGGNNDFDCPVHGGVRGGAA
jgi:hypothetical protein